MIEFRYKNETTTSVWVQFCCAEYIHPDVDDVNHQFRFDGVIINAYELHAAKEQYLVMQKLKADSGKVLRPYSMDLVRGIDILQRSQLRLLDRTYETQFHALSR